MFFIIGLGNPGAQFEHTRHNAGFMAIDFFAKENNFPDFKMSKKYASLISKKDDVFLAKPQSFMNESGKAVKKIISNLKFQISNSNLVVVHDDIDLPLGKIKFSQKSGTGGHKGVDSVIQRLGHNDFIRLKIGIAVGDKKAEDVVLEKFSNEEQNILQGVLEKSAQALQYIIEHGIEKTMNEYHR